MISPGTNDIDIGENESITWVDFDSTGKELFAVDHIIGRYYDFWTCLEFYCVPECCGIDAFRFYPEDIVRAANEVDSTLLKKDLVQLKLDLLHTEKDIIESERINNLVDKNVFIKLLDHIISNIPI